MTKKRRHKSKRESGRHTPPPTTLYKYRAPSERAIDMLRSGTIWLAAPDSFNDPLDCKAELLGIPASDDASEERLQQTRVAMLAILSRRRLQEGQGLAGESSVQTALRLDRLLHADDLDTAYRFWEEWYESLPIKLPLEQPGEMRKEVEQLLDRVGVFSLSEVPDHMLLWTHYADNHRGFAFGLEVAPGSDLSDRRRCRPVRYVRDFPTLDLDQVKATRTWQFGVGEPRAWTDVSLTDPRIEAVIFRKSQVWSYEREWRFVESAGARERAFPGPLSEVIFGLRCPDAIRDQVRSAVAKLGATVRTREVRMKPNSFTLALGAV